MREAATLPFAEAGYRSPNLGKRSLKAGRFPPSQPDPTLVGRYASDQRTAMALGPTEPFARCTLDTRSGTVGWAKARKRRAHHIPTRTKAVGTLSALRSSSYGGQVALPTLRSYDPLLRRFRVVADRRARAHQVAVAIDVVDAADRATSTCRCARRRRGSSPRRGYRRGSIRRPRGRARCAARAAAASFDLSKRPSSTSAISSRIAIMASQKRSSSRLRFRFGRLDHQRARHRKAHGRRVEAVVDQPLGDVVDGDADGVLERRGSTMHSCATRPLALR